MFDALEFSWTVSYKVVELILRKSAAAGLNCKPLFQTFAAFSSPVLEWRVAIIY